MLTATSVWMATTTAALSVYRVSVTLLAVPLRCVTSELDSAPVLGPVIWIPELAIVAPVAPIREAANVSVRVNMV